MYLQKTLHMKATEGYIVNLGAVGHLDVLAKAECFVQAINSNTDPMPPAEIKLSPGQSIEGIHLEAGERLTLGQDFAKGYDERIHDRITHLLVWAVTAGDLVLVAH